MPDPRDTVRRIAEHLLREGFERDWSEIVAEEIVADRRALLDDLDRELKAEQQGLTGQALYYLGRARQVVRRVRERQLARRGDAEREEKSDG